MRRSSDRRYRFHVRAHAIVCAFGLPIAGLVACSSGGPAIGPVAPTQQSNVAGPASREASIVWKSQGPIFSHGNAGKINAFAYVRENPNVMFVAGGWGNTQRESPSQAGIYKTVDGGQHWQPADDGLTNPDGTISSVVNGLWIDPDDSSVVLAATEFGGTFRSSDSGAHWQNVDRSESTQFARVDATLYLATRKGVLASTDAGASWRVSLPSTSGATTVVSTASVLYAGDTAGDVYRLAASQWRRVGHPGTGAIHDLAIDPFDHRIVYANVDDSGAWNENLYGSIDGGVSWVRVDCHCQVGAQAIAFSSVVPGRLYVGDDGPQTIRNLEANGTQHPTIHPGGDVHGNDVRYIVVVHRSAAEEACYSLTDQGVFYDAKCASGPAVGLTNAVPNFLAYDVSLPSNDSNIVVPLQDWNAVAGTKNGALHSLKAQEGGESFVDPFDPTKCYLAHPDEGLYRSFDGCDRFSGPHGRGIESLAFAPPTGRRTYAIVRDDRNTAHVAESDDSGRSWHDAFGRFYEPYQIVVSPLDPKSLIVATGTPRTQNRVFASLDGGNTWRESSGLPRRAIPSIEQWFPAHELYVAPDPHRNGIYLLADHDPITNNVSIFRSIDGGRRFSHVSTLDQPPTQRPWPVNHFPDEEARIDSGSRYYAQRFYGNRLAFDPRTVSGCEASVVLTTRFGAFQSFDGGSSWRRIDGSAIPHQFIGASWVDGTLYLASFGNGVIASSNVERC